MPAEPLETLRGYSPIVFANSAAAGMHTQSLLPRIRKIFDAFGIPVKFALTQDLTELRTAAQKALVKNHKLLLAMGGDGTFQALVNATFGERALLGVIPAGGGNDFAAALGMPVDPVKAAEAILKGAERSVDLVRVQYSTGQRFYLGGGGTGLDAESMQYANGRYRRLPGRLRYVASALHALCVHKPLEIRIDFPESDQPATEARALLAAVLNSPTYGAGVRLAPDAQIDDGLLDVVMVEDLQAGEVIRLLPRLMTRGVLQTSHIKRWRAKRVRLTTNRTCLFHGDGEIFGNTPVEIEVLPRAIQVLAPPTS